MPSRTQSDLARMTELLRPVFEDQPVRLSEQEMMSIAALPRDTLCRFLIKHACFEVSMPESLTLWYDGGTLNGWCRHCGGTELLGLGVVAKEPRVWWVVLALVSWLITGRL